MEFVTIRSRIFGLARINALKHSRPFLQSNIGIPRNLKKMELGLNVSSKGIIPHETWKNVKKTKKTSNLVIFVAFVYLQMVAQKHSYHLVKCRKKSPKNGVLQTFLAIYVYFNLVLNILNVKFLSFSTQRLSCKTKSLKFCSSVSLKFREIWPK